MKRLLAAAAALFIAGSASAALVPVTPTGSGVTFDMTTDGTNYISYGAICGPTSYAALAAGQCVNPWVINGSGQGLVLEANSAAILAAVQAGTGSTGAAPPPAAIYLGVRNSGATGGYMQGQIVCDNHVYKHITTATNTQLVTGVASQTVYICGFEAKFAGTATVYLANDGGTSSSCGDTLTQIGGLYSGVAQSFAGWYNPIWGGFKSTAAGNGICVVSTGTGGVDVDAWTTQF